MNPDASEHFLFENRRIVGFDKSLPAEGLLICYVVANRAVLGSFGPRTNLPVVLYPSKAKHLFTPFTTPESH